MHLFPAVLEPQLDLLGRDAIELRFELREAFRRRVAIELEGRLQHVQLFRRASRTVVLCLELAETRECLPAMLKPFGYLRSSDA